MNYRYRIELIRRCRRDAILGYYIAKYKIYEDGTIETSEIIKCPGVREALTDFEEMQTKYPDYEFTEAFKSV